jgi:hypothetical protein
MNDGILLKNMCVGAYVITHDALIILEPWDVEPVNK